MRTLVSLTLACAGLAACAPMAMPMPAQTLAAGETSIAFAANGGIKDWYSNSDQSIYLRDRSGRWYLATFDGVCPNLGAAQTISFQTDAGGSFDRFSTITSEYGRCQVGSVVPALAPAAKGGGLARP